MSELLSQSYLLKMNSRDTIPENSLLDANSTSVYARRYEVNKPAINGSTFQPNSEIRFRLNGGGATGVVPSTMCLHFKVQTSSTGGGGGNAGCAFDQHPALAVISRFRSFVSGGKAVDDVNYCNNFSHAMLQLDGNKNWTKTSGSNMLGSWKYNPQFMPFSRSSEDNDPKTVLEAENAVISRAEHAVIAHTAGLEVSVPLALLGCSLANQNTILPLQALGMIEIVITLSSVQKAIATLFGDDTITDLSYTVQNPTLRCSFVEFNADYNRLFLDLIQGGTGYRMPLNCVNVQQQTSAIGAGASMKDFVFSGAYRAVQDLVMWKTHPDVDDRLPSPFLGANQNNTCQFSLSTQRCGNQNHFRINISGRNYPDYDAITTLDEMWWYNQNGLSALNDYQSAVGMSDMSKFDNVSVYTITAPYNVDTVPYNAITPTRGNFLMLQSFKSAREAHNISIQGADLSIAGSVIRVSINDNNNGSGSANEALYCAFRHQRLLSLANGELNVEF